MRKEWADRNGLLEVKASEMISDDWVGEHAGHREMWKSEYNHLQQVLKDERVSILRLRDVDYLFYREKEAHETVQEDNLLHYFYLEEYQYQVRVFSTGEFAVYQCGEEQMEMYFSDTCGFPIDGISYENGCFLCYKQFPDDCYMIAMITLDIDHLELDTIVRLPILLQSPCTPMLWVEGKDLWVKTKEELMRWKEHSLEKISVRLELAEQQVWCIHPTSHHAIEIDPHTGDYYEYLVDEQQEMIIRKKCCQLAIHTLIDKGDGITDWIVLSNCVMVFTQKQYYYTFDSGVGYCIISKRSPVILRSLSTLSPIHGLDCQVNRVLPLSSHPPYQYIYARDGVHKIQMVNGFIHMNALVDIANGLEDDVEIDRCFQRVISIASSWGLNDYAVKYAVQRCLSLKESLIRGGEHAGLFMDTLLRTTNDIFDHIENPALLLSLLNIPELVNYMPSLVDRWLQGYPTEGDEVRPTVPALLNHVTPMNEQLLPLLQAYVSSYATEMVAPVESMSYATSAEEMVRLLANEKVVVTLQDSFRIEKRVPKEALEVLKIAVQEGEQWLQETPYVKNVRLLLLFRLLFLYEPHLVMDTYDQIRGEDDRSYGELSMLIPPLEIFNGEPTEAHVRCWIAVYTRGKYYGIAVQTYISRGLWDEAVEYVKGLPGIDAQMVLELFHILMRETIVKSEKDEMGKRLLVILQMAPTSINLPAMISRLQVLLPVDSTITIGDIKPYLLSMVKTT